MQNKIVEEIEITPEEVRQFFSIPKYERPVFGAELELAQIVINPKVSEDEEQKVIRRLETIKNDVVVNGSSFATKANYIHKTQVLEQLEACTHLIETDHKW